MHVETEIKKWGNSLAIRLSGAMAELPRLQEGTRVSIDISNEALVIKPVKAIKKLKLPYSENSLVASLTPVLAHADELARPIGNELGE
jgi:antitoxin MazE